MFIPHLHFISYPLCCNKPPIAQLVEQLPLKQTVQGSNPCGRINYSYPQTVVDRVDKVLEGSRMLLPL